MAFNTNKEGVEFNTVISIKKCWHPLMFEGAGREALVNSMTTMYSVFIFNTEKYATSFQVVKHCHKIYTIDLNCHIDHFSRSEYPA